VVFAGEHVDISINQVLLRWHLVPCVQRIYPGEKYIFWRIQRWLALLTPPSAVGILIFSGLATIFVGLELSGLLYLMCFAGESPGYA
jgi:hypothetical protein